jgi:hypothetical protein
MSIGVTILLSMTMFLNMVSQTMPVTSDNPLLGNNDRLPVGAYRQIDRQNMYVAIDWDMMYINSMHLRAYLGNQRPASGLMS